jgi:acetylornithine deacetylase/succinyl-diaminopimelate desuccinylase family protein
MTLTLQDAVEQQLIGIIASYEPDIVTTCSRMIQTPSVNGVHDELALAEVIAEEARRLGLHAELVAEDPRRPNVIVTTDDSGETGLLLLGHLDTVPPGDEDRWTYPPYGGIVADGKVHGRGAIDTKGGMTASLYALAAIKRAGALHKGRAQLICVPNEESGATGELGIKFLGPKGLIKGLGAVYAYSGDEIILGHRGLIRFRLTAAGQAIHTGAREWQERTSGANAVTGMARLLLELEALEIAHSTHKYFDQFRTVITPGTMIEGGISINVVPNHCEALVDIRITPEYGLDRIQTMLDAAIARAERPGITFSCSLLNYAPAAISDEDAPIFSILETVIEQVKAVSTHRAVAGPANEGYLLIERGIPTACGLGPAGENAHAVNEYVTIQGLLDAASIFSLTARRLSAYLP